MATVELTELELLDAIRAAIEKEADGDDALTTEQVKDKLGWGDNRTRRIIRRLVAAGTLVPVQVRRKNVVGQFQTMWAYRLAAVR